MLFRPSLGLFMLTRFAFHIIQDLFFLVDILVKNNAVLNSLQANKKLIKQAVKIAKTADVVLLVIGGNESTCREVWSYSHRGDRDNLNLFGNQEELVKAVIKTGRPVVTLLLNERPLTINYLAENADALIEKWFLG